MGITCIQNTKSCRKISDIYGNCSQCYDGYTLAAGACIQCTFTGCLPANSTVVGAVCTCADCLQGYYLTAPTCTPCTTVNCAVCPGDTCSSCITGFYLNVATCSSSTAANCKTASSASLCSVCNDGYYLGTDNLCYNCQANCLKCTDRYTCTTCNEAGNYYLHSSNSCLAMPSNCVALATDFTCQLCSYGFYLYNGYCVQCSVELGTVLLPLPSSTNAKDSAPSTTTSKVSSSPLGNPTSHSPSSACSPSSSDHQYPSIIHITFIS